MELVEIDVVRAQAAQAVFDGLANILGARAVAGFVELHAELGGDDGLAPPAGERAAEIFFAVAFIVDVGGIEEIDAGIERHLDHAGGLRGVDAPAEIVASQTGEGDFQSSDFAALRSGCLHNKLDAARAAGIRGG